MKRTKAILFVLMALLVLGSMFGSADAQKPPTDTLTVAASVLAEETFLPWNGSAARSTYLSMIYDSLAYTDPKTDEMMPGLATKWEMSPDGKTWTFYLRRGVQFQEGWGELTSADVKYCVERGIGKDASMPSAGALRALIDRVETPEPYKVVIYLKNPYAGLVTCMLFNGDPAGLIACKKYVETVGDEKANAHPIGTGPYTLAEEHKKGGSFKFVTIPGVEKHWRITPEFKTVTVLLVPEEATRVAMLKTGEVDLAPISYDSIDMVKASGLHILSIPRCWTPQIRFGGLIATDPKRYNPANPWAKKDVRQALNYAIDKETIAKNIFKGMAAPTGAEGPVPAWVDIPPYPYDPAKAKQLLAQAGYPNGFPLTLKTMTQDPGAQLPMIGEAVAMYWKAIGIDVKIVPTEWGAIRSEIIGGKANDFAWTFRDMAFNDSLKACDLNFDVNGFFCCYGTAESRDRYTKAKSEFDIKKRDQLVKELGLFVREEAGFVPLVSADQPYGASKKVGSWPTLRQIPTNLEMITHP